MCGVGAFVRRRMSRASKNILMKELLQPRWKVLNCSWACGQPTTAAADVWSPPLPCHVEVDGRRSGSAVEFCAEGWEVSGSQETTRCHGLDNFAHILPVTSHVSQHIRHQQHTITPQSCARTQTNVFSGPRRNALWSSRLHCEICFWCSHAICRESPTAAILISSNLCPLHRLVLSSTSRCCTAWRSNNK